MIQYSDLDATNFFWYTQIWKPGTRLNYLDRGEQGGFQDSNRLRLISRFKQFIDSNQFTLSKIIQNFKYTGLGF